MRVDDDLARADPLERGSLRARERVDDLLAVVRGRARVAEWAAVKEWPVRPIDLDAKRVDERRRDTAKVSVMGRDPVEAPVGLDGHHRSTLAGDAEAASALDGDERDGRRR